MKKLNAYQLEERRNNPNYFSNGKPKKSAMMCRSRQYIAEVTSINGVYYPEWCCAGNRCPLYALGCDNEGKDWD